MRETTFAPKCNGKSATPFLQLSRFTLNYWEGLRLIDIDRKLGDHTPEAEVPSNRTIILAICWICEYGPFTSPLARQSIIIDTPVVSLRYYNDSLRGFLREPSGIWPRSRFEPPVTATIILCKNRPPSIS
jgi:hypothetical protein